MDERKNFFCEMFSSLDLSVYSENFLMTMAENEVNVMEVR